jgi:hypothetical protein
MKPGSLLSDEAPDNPRDSRSLPEPSGGLSGGSKWFPWMRIDHVRTCVGTSSARVAALTDRERRGADVRIRVESAQFGSAKPSLAPTLLLQLELF